MNPEFEAEAVMALGEFGADWEHSPVFDEPGLVHMTDQFAALIIDNMTGSGMTEPERVTFAMGYVSAARQVHGQLVAWGIHDEDGPAHLCEATGMLAGVVARQAIAPPTKGRSKEG